MSDGGPAPNELADLYDGLLLLLESLPEQSYPAWEFVLESVLFGGDGLATDATSYGEQQANRNDFKITAYRDRYGDGGRVTEFPSVETEAPRPDDKRYVPDSLELPVAPQSNRVLPVDVDEASFADAITLLRELPSTPEAQHSVSHPPRLLNPGRIPGVTQPSVAQSDREETETVPPSHGNADSEDEVRPNRLADLYEGLKHVVDCIPDDGQPSWRRTLQSVLNGGEYLEDDATPYGEQQATRNSIQMSAYRRAYGDGDRVTEFPSVRTQPPREPDQIHVDGDTEVLVAPESNRPLPVDPSIDELPTSLALLGELPASPATGPTARTESRPLRECLVGVPVDRAATDRDDTDEHDTDKCEADSEKPDDEIVLRESGPGEVYDSFTGENSPELTGDWKHADPRAERAHRRARQRDPSDVVEIGEEITLVLKEVDHTSQPPTVMGTKETLVVFITEAPQDLSEQDIIRAKVVDFGGKRTSAEAVFLDYQD